MAGSNDKKQPQAFPPPRVHRPGARNFSRPSTFAQHFSRASPSPPPPSRPPPPPPTTQQQPPPPQEKKADKMDWIPGMKEKRETAEAAQKEKEEEEAAEINEMAWKIRRQLANTGLNPKYKYNYLADQPKEKDGDEKDEDDVAMMIASFPTPSRQEDGDPVTPWPDLYPQANVFASLNREIHAPDDLKRAAYQEVFDLLSDTWLAITGQKTPTIFVAKILDEVLGVKLAPATPQPVSRKTSTPLLASFANAPIMGAAPSAFTTTPEKMSPALDSDGSPRPDSPTLGASQQNIFDTKRKATNPKTIVSTPHIAAIEKWTSVVNNLIYCPADNQKPHQSPLKHLTSLSMKIARAVLKHTGHDLAENKAAEKAQREKMEIQMERVQWKLSDKKGSSSGGGGDESDPFQTRDSQQNSPANKQDIKNKSSSSSGSIDGKTTRRSPPRMPRASTPVPGFRKSSSSDTHGSGHTASPTPKKKSSGDIRSPTTFPHVKKKTSSALTAASMHSPTIKKKSSTGSSPNHPPPSLKKTTTTTSIDTWVTTTTTSNPAETPQDTPTKLIPPMPSLTQSPYFAAGLRAAFATKFVSWAETWVEWAKWVEDEKGLSEDGGFNGSYALSSLGRAAASEKRAIAVAERLGWLAKPEQKTAGKSDDEDAGVENVDVEKAMERDVVWAKGGEVDGRMREMARRGEGGVWRRCERQMRGKALRGAKASEGLEAKKRFGELWREEFGGE
ncbi:hypothetical protein K490DRAFT_65369 [Saccharata proteae CBS 121410]|uniref:Uncharacterized protein n=1 Tax=Saccharata proteae CBS 121410 TaxID=1314787 RepID=A0A9P4LXE3_9PEZI|nr:hypothetical protein K490DRAFT_65369 [Saccharata proteae CBS 121410]